MKLISIVCLIATVTFTMNSLAKPLNISMSECASINDNKNRLTCFDQLANNISAAPVNNNTITSIKPKAKTNRSEVINSFGATHLKKRASKSEEEKTITLTVASIKKDAYKRLRLTFVNGQVWKQTSDEHLKIKSGDQAKLTEGALGAIYLKKLGKNRTIRVKRFK